MSKVTVTESYLEGIGDAIRNKLNTSQGYTPGQMAAAINSIPTGGITPTGTISITQNGLTDVTQYAEAAVNVPNSYAAGDEGKVVDNGVLVSQTGTTVTQNGTVDTTLNNEVVVNVPNSYTASDEGKVVQSGALVAQTSETITQNGTYDTTTKDEVVVNVSGGGGGVSWKDQLATNWDFSNPVNTRGSSNYGGAALIYTIDGWQLQGGKLSFVPGGIKLERYSSGTAGFFMQRLMQKMTSALVGRVITMSAIVDGELYSTTATVASGAGTTGHGMVCNGVAIRGYNYGTEIAWTIDIGADTGSHIIQAIKIEAGSSQTLATKINGVWVLNNNMDADTEYIKARSGMIYNS